VSFLSDMGGANTGLALTHGALGAPKFAARVEWHGQAAIVRGCALVAQLDRASDFESEGREFESLRARQ
jgi:hypothetical protein